MARYTAVATIAALSVWTIAVISMGTMENRVPRERVYAPNGLTIMYQDPTGKFTRAMRGANATYLERDF